MGKECTMNDHNVNQNELNRKIHYLGGEILRNQIIDNTVELSLDKHSSALLDSGWLHRALHYITYKVNFEIKTVVGQNVELSSITPVNAEEVIDILTTSEAANTFFYQFKDLKLEDIFLLQKGAVRFNGKESVKRVSSFKLALNKLASFANIRKIRTLVIEAYHLERDFFVAQFNPFNKFFLHYPSASLFEDPYNQEIDISKRIEISQRLEELFNRTEVPWPSQFNPAAASFLGLFIPMTHLEQRCSNFNNALKYVVAKGVKNIFSLVGIYSSTPTIFLAAGCKQNGGKVIGMQHGGYYGYSATHGFPLHTEGMWTDLFLTWGWEHWPNDVGEAKTKCLSAGSFYLKHVREKYYKTSKSHEDKTSVLFCPSGFHSTEITVHEETPNSIVQDKVWPVTVNEISEIISKLRASIDIKFYPT
ncbi:MAG: hypothetical protein EOP48_23630, partial [Sphingobacteriales bacterium]